MTQESCKNDLEIEVQQMIQGKEVTINTTYESVDIDQAYDIINKLMEQSCIIKNAKWR